MATILDPFPRVRLASLPTPLEPLPRLSEFLGGPRILVKRDDQTGLALAGNKARKLEYLAATRWSSGIPAGLRHCSPIATFSETGLAEALIKYSSCRAQGTGALCWPALVGIIRNLKAVLARAGGAVKRRRSASRRSDREEDCYGRSRL